tara:strand:- start:4458 stop:4769 length:312 start_codon:yes stop_codon:yes gene_type:complete
MKGAIVDTFIRRVQESKDILRQCSSNVNEFIENAHSLSQESDEEHATEWANTALKAISEANRKEDISVLAIAKLLRLLHGAGIHLLESSMTEMLNEEFIELKA